MILSLRAFSLYCDIVSFYFEASAPFFCSVFGFWFPLGILLSVNIGVNSLIT